MHESEVVIDVARRVCNMRAYGMSWKDVHDEIVFSSEVPEDLFFLAWVAAGMQEEWE